MAVLTDIDRSGDKNLMMRVHALGLPVFSHPRRSEGVCGATTGQLPGLRGLREREPVALLEKLEYDKDSGIIKVTSRKLANALRLRAMSATGEGAMHPLLQGPANRVVQDHDRTRRDRAD